MPARRLSLRKVREILRLAAEAGLSKRQIARSLSVSPTTVGTCLRRAEAAGITWPLAEEMDEGALQALIYADEAPEPEHPLPEMTYLRRELARKGVTLKLLWMEYEKEHPGDHYSYSHFCNIYRAWSKSIEVSMRQVHKAGGKTFVDWAGDGIPIVDPANGEIWKAPLFVAALGASSYTFARAYPSAESACWIDAHMRAFAFFGGVTEIVVPDNTKTAVTKACRYEPDINLGYAHMAAHYGCAVIPARARKPRDKAKVESAVLQAERWIVAALRNRIFFTVAEANLAIAEQLTWLNDRKMTGLDKSRRELWQELDRPALIPLPERPYEDGAWKPNVGVNIDYHIKVEHNIYSVPYQLAGKKVDVRLTARTLEAFSAGKRVASHVRLHGKGQVATDPAHRPASHAACLEWTPSRIESWAAATGPATAELAAAIMARWPHPEQGYRACLGVIRLGKRYGAERLEAACRRALATEEPGYKRVKNILASGLDQEEPDSGERPPLPAHTNLRGPGYYN